MILIPKKINMNGRKVAISHTVEIKGDGNMFPLEFLKTKLKCGVSGEIICNKIEIIRSDKIPEDGFAVEVTEDSIKIYAGNITGANYAISFLSECELREGYAEDYPAYGMRGYKMFLPPPEDIQAAKDIADMLVKYRYNVLMLEIGGAMEYKSHPKIGEAWKELCRDVREYSGKGYDIANGKLYPWPKNVIHADNGGGGVLSQETVKELAEYFRLRGIKIIPEVPSLSHCDYIVRAYPELRERAEDTDYPDCYCPQNPKTYKVLFDILDEIIDIFSPEYINIGHDELFSIGLCDACRDKSPEELFVGDVIKIKEYLEKKGIKTMMWADMLSKNCERLGGAGRAKPGEAQYVPAMYMIRDMLPKDILMIDWWYNADESHADLLETLGFEILFGNLSVYRFKNPERFKKKCVLGGMASNWGSLEPEYMQRNGQYFNIIFNSLMLWNGCDVEKEKDKLFFEVMEEAFNKKDIEFLVSTDLHIQSGPFYDGDFIDDEKFIMGYIEATLKNGEKRRFELKYGYNIGCIKTEGEPYGEWIGLCSSAIPVTLEEGYFYKCQFDSDIGKEDIEKISFVKTNTESFEVKVIL